MIRVLPIGLVSVPAVMLLAACGGSSATSMPPVVTTPSLLSERQAFASAALDDQLEILSSGVADPADLPASASYSGNWAMSLDPGGNLEVIGGSAALQADFGAGSLAGSLQQEILDGAGGTLTIENGQIDGAVISGTVAGSLNDPGGGSIGVNTTLDGFVANAGVQGTMSGTATVGGQVVGAQGTMSATPD